MGDHSDKNVVMTGGSSGMGLAVAELLVRGGARVAITGRSQAKLDAARERLGGNGVVVRAMWLRCPTWACSPIARRAGSVRSRHCSSTPCLTPYAP